MTCSGCRGRVDGSEAPADGVAHQREARQSEHPDERFEIAKRVLRGVGWRPVGLAVASPVGGHHTALVRQSPSDGIPSVRVLEGAVQQEERWGGRITPIAVVNLPTVERQELVADGYRVVCDGHARLLVEARSHGAIDKSRV